MTLLDLRQGDCLEVLASLPYACVDAIVTDPPYGLSFMGKRWDYDVPSAEIWEQCLRVLKPGGHLLAFAGTRTQHRMAVNIEDAGFEIRDMIAWVYGSGFPKSHNLKDEWEGWGTALKPALEPITLARKPLIGTVAANVLKHGTGALNIDGCRVEGEPWKAHQATGLGSVKFFTQGETPVIEKAPHDGGRWPANLIHDGSEEVVELFPEAKGPGGFCDTNKPLNGHAWNQMNQRSGKQYPGETGSAARFFYCAKASKADREDGNVHPTVKPTDLMAYLCRLVTPPGGVVLDPFMGSGSTGKAAMREGFGFIGIERDAEYFAIAQQRVQLPRIEQLSLVA